MRVILNQRPHGRIFDRLGRLKVRLAAMQRMHLDSFGAHLHDLVANLHNIRESDLVQSLCEANSILFRDG